MLLYKEVCVFGDLIGVLKWLNYLEGNLEIILFIEKDDLEMLFVILFDLLDYFDIFVILDGVLKIKFRVLVYGFVVIIVEYVMIFDVEDCLYLD